LVWHGSPALPDDLWAALAPLLPPHPLRPKGGRPRLDDRVALTGILFVLRSGIPWEMLPAEMNRGCGMSCWRRLRDWQAAGVWRRLHRVLLERLHAADEIDESRASLDSASVPAKKGGLPLARTRRIAARRAPSATSSPTRAARRSASS
jgi:transposase